MAKYKPQYMKTIIDNSLTDMYPQIAESLQVDNVVDRDTALIIRGALGPIMFEDFKKFVSTEVTIEGVLMANHKHEYTDGVCDHCGAVDPDTKDEPIAYQVINPPVVSGGNDFGWSDDDLDWLEDHGFD